MERLLQSVGSFDPNWRRALEDFAAGSVSESVDSIVNLRHQVAHGRSGSLSVARITQYFDTARRLPRKLEELCVSAAEE